MDSLQRHLRKPLHALLCAATVVVAAGTAAVVFTFMNALWFRPPAVREPGRIVVVVHSSPMRVRSAYNPTALDSFRDMGVFDSVAGQLATSGYAADLTPNLILAQHGRLVETIGVTQEYFDVLGLPILGRDFSPADARPGAPTVVIISHELWRTSYHADPAVIGAVVDASPRPVQVIGIAPRGFSGALRGEHVQVWLPYTQVPVIGSATSLGNAIPMINLCRLRAGSTLAGTRQAFLAAMASQGRAIDDLDLVPLPDVFGAPDLPLAVVRNADMIRLVAAIALLLVAAGCTTLMALLLVHYQQRQREMVVRVALGATRGDLLKHVGAELAVIAVAGTLGVVATSIAAVKLLPRFTLPGGVDLGRLDLSPDWRVLLLTAATCVALVGLAAIVPVLRLTGRGAAAFLNESGSTGTQRVIRTRRVVLAAHAALTVLILIIAALFIRSALDGLTQGPGFDTAKTLFVSVGIPSTRGWGDAAAQAAFARYGAAAGDLLQAVRALPEVEGAAVGDPPLAEQAIARLDRVTPFRTDDGTIDLNVTLHPVGLGYLEALGVPLLLGRAPRSPGELVISATLAADAWPSQSPIGRSLDSNGVHGTVVGVVDMGFGSVRLGRPDMFLVFDAGENLPAAFQSRRRFDFVVRSSVPTDTRRRVNDLARQAFPDAPYVRLTSGRELVERDLGQERLGAWFLSVVGASAWLLGVASIFGLVGYVVECRRREFGVRMALGASTRDLLRLATWAGTEPAIVGGLVGLVGALWSARIVESYLLGTSAVAPQAWAAGFGLFVASAAIASLVAALRVRRIHPIQALRAE